MYYNIANYNVPKFLKSLTQLTHNNLFLYAQNSDNNSNSTAIHKEPHPVLLIITKYTYKRVSNIFECFQHKG